MMAGAGGIALRALAWLAPALVAALVFWPALGAGFTGDDWTILALARHGSGPWAYPFADHTIAYSWRPVGMALWWLSTQLFADQPSGHYLVNLLLHALASLAVSLLVLRLGAARGMALVAGLLFAAHPAAVGTALWLSDRYDLLGTLGALLLLAVLVREASLTTPRLVALALAGALAAGSKETSFAVLPAAWLWLLLVRPRGALAAGLVLSLPFAFAIAARLLVFGGSGLGQMGEHAGGPLEHLAGALRWLALLPEVLAGRGAVAWLVLAIVSGALVLLLPAARAGWTRRRRAGLAALLVLALVPALLQAPITRLALAVDDPLQSITNHRFYHLALAALLAALALAMSRSGDAAPPPGMRPGHRAALGLALLAALALPWGWAAWRSASNWREVTAAPARLALNAAAVEAARVASAEADGACVLQLLDGSRDSEDVPGFVDSLVKARLAPGEPAMDCIVLAEAAPWVVLTGPGVPRLPAGFAPRGEGALFDSRPVLGMVVHFPGLPAADVAVARWRWSGTRLQRDGDHAASGSPDRSP